MIAKTNISYRQEPDFAGNPRLTLDLYTPANAPAPCPAIVWFHGGGLTEGTKDEDVPFAERLTEHGIALVTANYRFITDAPYLAYVEDAARAFAWTLENAAQYGIDTTRVFIGGASAGGYLAALTVMNPRFLAEAGVDAASVRGAVFLSAQLTTHFMVRAQGGAPKDAIVSDEAAPIYHARKDTPPLLLITADNDIPARLEENVLFTAVMKSLGHKHISFHVIPGRDHGSVCNGIREPGDPVGALITEFLLRNSTPGSM